MIMAFLMAAILFGGTYLLICSSMFYKNDSKVSMVLFALAAFSFLLYSLLDSGVLQ